MKATSGTLPKGSGWAYELKWDGMRVLADVRPEAVSAWTSNGLDATTRFPELAALGPALAPVECVLDGEVVALDARGRPSFTRLQHRMHVATPAKVRLVAEEVPVEFVVFDLLRLGGHDTTGLPWSDRHRLLAGPGGGLPARHPGGPGVRRRRGAPRRHPRPGPGGRDGQAGRLDLPAGQPHPLVGQGEGPPPAGGGGRRLGAGRGQPGGRAGLAAHRGPRRAGSARAALRRPGRLGLHRRRAAADGAPAAPPGRRRLPVHARAPVALRARRRTGCGPRWWSRSPTASGPTTAACATPSTWASATTSTRRRSCRSRPCDDRPARVRPPGRPGPGRRPTVRLPTAWTMTATSSA